MSDDVSIDGERLLTSYEVAKIAGLTRQRIDQLRRDGVLPAVTATVTVTVTRFRDSDVAAWMARRKRTRPR